MQFTFQFNHFNHFAPSVQQQTPVSSSDTCSRFYTPHFTMALPYDFLFCSVPVTSLLLCRMSAGSYHEYILPKTQGKTFLSLHSANDNIHR